MIGDIYGKSGLYDEMLRPSLNHFLIQEKHQKRKNDKGSIIICRGEEHHQKGYFFIIII